MPGPLAATAPAPVQTGEAGAPAVPKLNLSGGGSPTSPQPRNKALQRRAQSPLAPGSVSLSQVPSARSMSAGKERPKSSRDGGSGGGSGEPTTPRKKKQSRQLRVELHHVIVGLRKMQYRVDQARVIVQGTRAMLRATADESFLRLKQNPQLAKKAACAASFTPPALTNGQMTKDDAWSSGVPEKVIVEAVSKLAKSSETSFEMLEEHEALTIQHVGLLDQMITDLTDHHKAHDVCIRSLSLNPSSPPPLTLQGSYHMGKWEYEPTHDALSIAADREDAARITMLRCLKATQSARSELERRKSAVQVAVRSARAKQHKDWVSRKFGNFGSSDARTTDPAKRKVHHTPESTPDHQWPAEQPE